MNFEIVLYSLIIGFLGGGCIAVGAARMFYAPKIQAMGAFRTLGELNACNGDPIAHYSFGLGFLFNAAVSVVGAGALSQDVLHRIVPNFTAGTVLLGKNREQKFYEQPSKMLIYGGIIGAAVVTFLNTLASVIPAELSNVASKILTPATTAMLNPIMPIIFWLAAMDAGKETGVWGTVLGGISQLVSGNATPGIVLGILIGKTAEENGYKNKIVWILISIVTIMFLAIAYYRDFFTKMGLPF